MNEKRRNLLKGAALLGAMPVAMKFSPLSDLVGLSASELGTGLVKNGEVVTAAHWGMLKVTVKDGVIVKSEPLQKTSEISNPLQNFTADMVYKSRIKYPMVRKSYLANPDSPKPELRGRD